MDANARRGELRRLWEMRSNLDPAKVRARHPENLAPIVELAVPQPSDRLLDVACGWGFVPLELAPRVKKVVGIDLVPRMVEVAREVARRRGVPNVEYHEADVADLGSGLGKFEIVTCRFAFHHFPDQPGALARMKRMLSREGRIVLYDFTAAADADKARLHNEIETVRDPSHVRIPTLREYQELFRDAGLAAAERITTLWKRDFGEWMSILGPDGEIRERVRTMLADSMEGNRTGLGVRIRDGNMTFTHTSVAWLLRPER